MHGLDLLLPEGELRDPVMFVNFFIPGIERVGGARVRRG